MLRLHPVSQHDGPLSVRRAYSADELAALAEKAGVHARIQAYPWLARLVAEHRLPEDEAALLAPQLAYEFPKKAYKL